MILLVWLYVTGLVFLIGGEINAEIERPATREHSEPKSLKVSGHTMCHANISSRAGFRLQIG
jgi:hypothetical protein